jgi:hypothetical protein
VTARRAYVYEAEDGWTVVSSIRRDPRADEVGLGARLAADARS